MPKGFGDVVGLARELADQKGRLAFGNRECDGLSHCAEVERTILIVDRSAVARKALARALTSPQRRVIALDDPHRARRVLSLLPIDLLISSISAAEPQGVDLLEHAHRVHPTTRRVACTASQDFGLIRAAINRGAAEFFLEKPWDRVGLADLIVFLEAEPERRSGRDESAAVNAPVLARRTRPRCVRGDPTGRAPGGDQESHLI